MKKLLYYTIELGTDTINEDEKVLTGNKTITVYTIENNVPKQFCDIECDINDGATDQIQNYLNDNGHGDEDYQLIIL